MADSQQGYEYRLATDDVATGPIDAASKPFSVLTCDIGKKVVMLADIGSIGNRSNPSERVREGVHDISGTVVMNPGPDDLDIWLPKILGTPAAGDVFALGDVLEDFAIGIDYGGIDLFQYFNCKVARATFRGTEQGLLEMAVEIVGKTQNDLGSWPAMGAPNIGVTNKPYLFAEGALTLTGARTYTAFELVIDNVLVTRFGNSLTATDIRATDRIVTLRPTIPYDSATLFPSIASVASATLVFTNGAYSLTFAFGSLIPNIVAPALPGKSEIFQDYEYIARTVSTTKELITTSDAST